MDKPLATVHYVSINAPSHSKRSHTRTLAGYHGTLAETVGLSVSMLKKS